MKPSEAFRVLNEIAASVETGWIDAEQACRELCIDGEGAPADMLTRWLNGTTNPALVTLMDGQSVHFQRFRVAMNEAFHLVNQRRLFAK